MPKKRKPRHAALHLRGVAALPWSRVGTASGPNALLPLKQPCSLVPGGALASARPALAASSSSSRAAPTTPTARRGLAQVPRAAEADAEVPVLRRRA